MGGDAYLLWDIIHDWNQDQCLTILGNCRKSHDPEQQIVDHRVRLYR
ncbi:MAG: methyltransferase, partial [Anaerolineae bacterium]